MTYRSRWAPAAMAAGAALLVATAVIACGAQPEPDEGADTVRSLSATPSAARPTTEVPVNDGALPRRDSPIAPVKMTIEAIGVTATVVPTGVDPRTGDFDVPPSVDRVGWYRFGPGLDASAGSTVIAGHVDSASQGRGAFFRLRQLSDGDLITVTGDDGKHRRYTVVGREEYRKSRIPLDRYFARDGKPRLSLITCGGPFDQATRHYRDNIVVTAVPTLSGA
ncbi:sortase family protein [Asanoa ferruginea]|uniref:Sortase family protein n=1 Tax=Asanoa ferruginea TaxID=53367 RepID=A0A3D9ZVV5_9ACTN|nr:class F sortase [Asanoa ferruginea]REG01409.1 sortase family protein [Asanoa ferruginea]GIF47966.1 class F sortase [Asanoa ferruginea]